MKKNLYKLCGVLLLGVVVLVVSACKDEFYTINDSFYDNMQLVLKNPLQAGGGDVLDTLRVEQDNVDQIMIEELSDPTLIFAPESFIYELENEEIVSIGSDGSVTPISRGATRLDIIFRANKTLKISVIVEVYKEYQAVEEIQTGANIASIIEVDESYDLSNMLIVLPLNADNKKLHFSLDAASEQYATITDEGIITGVKNSGRNRATIHVVSDDNPEVTTSFRVQVVNEILITAVNVTPGLDGVGIGIGTTIDLNLCTSVSPVTVNEKNRKLSFELLEGTGVLSLSDEGVIKAIAVGTAKIKATSKNGISAEFTINVKEGLTDLLRLFWDVTTSVPYAMDGAVNGPPEYMLDDDATTYYVVVKPGKTYNNVSTPSDHVPYFTVDMKSAQKFNYIRWNNRSGNANNYLRVWAIDFAGSDDGETFTDIQTNIALDYSKTSKQEIVIPESEYRYVRVTLTKWSDLVDASEGGSTSGMTMQIGEFGLGYK